MGRPRKKKTKSNGLGDDIAKVTKAVGIDKLVKAVFGEDCGCEERQVKLNKMFPHHKPECLTEIEYNDLTRLLKLTRFDAQDNFRITAISRRVMHKNHGQRISSCGPCMLTVIEDLQKVYDNYKKDLTV